MEGFVLQFISNSENDTLRFANRLAGYLKKGDIVILSGDLGAGKTKFTQGFLQYYGLENEISSPTFTIVNEYHTKSVSIYHFDVYRLADVDEFYAMGGDEYFQNGICIIEWGELIEEILPPTYLKIHFEKDEQNEHKRILTLEPKGERFQKIMEVICKNEHT